MLHNSEFNSVLGDQAQLSAVIADEWWAIISCTAATQVDSNIQSFYRKSVTVVNAV
jgi:hypothetical protein